MVSFRRRLGLMAAVLALPIVVAGSTSAHAAPQDYRFEVVQQSLKKGQIVALDVRLVHVPSGKPVADAIVVQTRLDMSPEGMGDMAAKLAPQPSPAPGIYRFETKVEMEGDWALALAAKVPGEAETIRGTVPLKAAK